MLKIINASTFSLLIFLIAFIPSATVSSAPVFDCRVDVLIWKVNGDCKGTITCDDDQYWIDCCSDLGTAVGWCELPEFE